MFGYLEKFKQLPKELQAAVTSPEATRLIGELEKNYGVELASAVIKIMVKEIPWPSLVEFLTEEHHLPRERAEKLRQELADKIFLPVASYLGIPSPLTPLPPERARGLKERSLQRSEVKTMPEPERESGVFAKDLPKFKKIILSKKTELVLPLAGDDFIANITPEIISLAGIGGQAERRVKLQNIIKTFVKGIRDFISARDALTKEPVNGGLGLTREQAEAILNLAKKQREKPAISPIAPQSAPLDYLEKTRDIEYDFSKLAKQAPAVEPPAKIKEEKKPESDLKQDLAELSKEIISPKAEELKLAPPLPAVRSERPAARDEKKTQISKVSSQQKPEPEMVKMDRSRLAVSQSDKPRMDDIMQPPSRLQGPIEELANLDLINFRRLGGSLEVIAGKIQNKIKLLERESFTRRQQGINAWRHSPLYLSYVAIGQESLTGNQPVEELLKTQGNGLTKEEFNAILELNRQLRV
ncbi:hypothetical protein COU00_03985 [Candidatus Falkowbacteria bacterium CG10_big_fil_rev_8_21_14_0_10_43_11]|uniref:Uncharacterized protein n=1 Tax=Candidatus Falkowbacteria bacterium CG10_big_fil_rev_8_21_14_0_10_43_11 TaxID=1974568 RepID=A0A2M6WL39_9BACT|nr:MAG: hypothetical protein COU00_03985 [Candidatus Falkowbacteria bacterium CG10_big_fil_rev_8_21_14_0_10_43_11]